MISTRKKQLMFGAAAVAVVIAAALTLYKTPGGDRTDEAALFAGIEVAAGDMGTPEEMMEAKREVAEKLNKKMPVKVDEITTLQSVEATDEGFTYHTQLEMAKADMPDPEETADQIRPQLAQGVCAEAFAEKIMKDMGQAFTYVYKDMAGEIVMTVKITQKDCI